MSVVGKPAKPEWRSIVGLVRVTKRAREFYENGKLGKARQLLSEARLRKEDYEYKEEVEGEAGGDERPSHLQVWRCHKSIFEANVWHSYAGAGTLGLPPDTMHNHEGGHALHLLKKIARSLVDVPLAIDRINEIIYNLPRHKKMKAPKLEETIRTRDSKQGTYYNFYIANMSSEQTQHLISVFPIVLYATELAQCQAFVPPVVAYVKYFKAARRHGKLKILPKLWAEYLDACAAADFVLSPKFKKKMDEARNDGERRLIKRCFAECYTKAKDEWMLPLAMAWLGPARLLHTGRPECAHQVTIKSYNSHNNGIGDKKAVNRIVFDYIQRKRSESEEAKAMYRFDCCRPQKRYY